MHYLPNKGSTQSTSPVAGVKEIVKYEQRVDGSVIRHVHREKFLACRHEIMVCVDCSGSMAPYLGLAADATMDFCNAAVKRHHHVGLLDFAGKAHVLLRPTRNTVAIRTWLNKMLPGGKTNIAGAIKAARGVLIGHHARSMLILSDGRPEDPASALREASRAKAQGIDVLTIGLGEARQDFLEELATAEQLVVMTDYHRIPEGFAQAASLLPALLGAA